MGPKEALQAVTGGFSERTQVSTAKLVTLVAVGPGAGGTRGVKRAGTASANSYTPRSGASASPGLGEGTLSPLVPKAEAEMVSRPDWGFARAELGTTTEGFCSPKSLPAQKGSSKSKLQVLCLENLTRNTQNPVEEGSAAAKGEAAGLGSWRSCCSCSRKQQFPLEKASKTKSQAQARVWQGIWLLLAQPSFGSKPQANCLSLQQRVAQQKGLLLQHLQPPATPCTGAFSRAWTGLASSAERRASRHSLQPRATELLYCRLHAHTQANKSASWQSSGTKQSCQVPEHPAHPRDPSCVTSAPTRHFWGSQFGLGQSL